MNFEVEVYGNSAAELVRRAETELAEFAGAHHWEIKVIDASLANEGNAFNYAGQVHAWVADAPPPAPDGGAQ